MLSTFCNRIKTIKNKTDYRFVISLIASWTLLLMFISKTLGEDNLIYAIGELKTYNSSLYNGNVYIGSGVVSPRYIVDVLFDALMHLNGGDWAGASLIWVYFGAFIQAIGIANIGYRINKDYQMFVSIILTCMIAYCENFLAGFSLIVLESTSIGVALAFSFLSLSFLVGKERNYKLAWIFAVCSLICHVHEGIYCCAVIFMIVLVDCFFQKKILIKENITIVVAALVLFAVVIPSLVTDTMELSNAEFVNIYSIFRHPHHLVPSAWGIDSIYKTFWIDFSLFLLSVVSVYVVNYKDIKKHIFECEILLLVWITAVTIMYVFTEVKPLAAVSTLFFSKLFKYVLLMGLIWILEAAFMLRERGLFLSAYLMFYFVFTVSSGDLKQIALTVAVVCVIVRLEEYFLKNNVAFVPSKIVPALDVIFFALIICIKRESLGLNIGAILNLVINFKSSVLSGMTSGFARGVVIIIVSFAVSAIFVANKLKFKGYRILSIFACACMVVFSLCGRVLIYQDGIKLINGEYALRNSVGDEIYDLAIAFRDKTDANEIFLADPDDTTNTGWFQVISQRNCYVVYKVIPSSRCTVDDWYSRYMEVSGFAEKTGKELEDIMNTNGISYLLVNSDSFSKIDDQENCTVYLNSANDSYRIYEVN